MKTEICERLGIEFPIFAFSHCRDVVAAVAEGKFHVYAVETVDQGIELLTGVPAGERDAEGRFPEGSVNALVEERLAAFARRARDFAGGGAKGGGSKGDGDGGGDAA